MTISKDMGLSQPIQRNFANAGGDYSSMSSYEAVGGGGSGICGVGPIDNCFTD